MRCVDMTGSGKLVVWAVLTGILVSNPAGARIYVDDDAALGGDGRSWETAFRYLQDGLNRVPYSYGEVLEEVWVAQGVYKPDRSEADPSGSGDREDSFHLRKPLLLRGGFAGLGAVDPNTWDPNVYETMLSGDLADNDTSLTDARDLLGDPMRKDNSYHVVVVGKRQHVDGEWIPRYKVEGIVIRGGHADDDFNNAPNGNGGGLLIEDYSHTTLRNCRIEDCVGVSGGAVFIYKNNQVEFFSCQFKSNGAKYGGGVYCWYVTSDYTVEFTDCTFKSNWVNVDGGGLFCQRSTVFVEKCSFVENECERDGGGINNGLGNLYLYDSFLEGNVSGYSGGGISNIGTLEVVNTHLKNNHCLGTGGGGGLQAGRVTIIRNSLFTGNQCDYYGGAIAVEKYQTLTSITNCTAIGNRATQGQFLSFGSFAPEQSALSQSFALLSLQEDLPIHLLGATTIQNSIIDNGGSEFLLSLYENSTLEVGYTNVVNNNDPPHDLGEGTILWGDGIISVDPCWVDPGYWDDNGTLDDLSDDTFVCGDYHLKSQAGRWNPVGGKWIQDDVTSACIDAGDPYAPIQWEMFPNGGNVNMGVYGGTLEASKTYFGEPPCETVRAGDINGDGVVDVVDLEILVRNWGLSSDD